MKKHRHACDITPVVVALQHPKESAAALQQRCNRLICEQIKVEGMTIDQPKWCPACGGFGHVVEGAQKFKCIPCDGTGVKS